MSALMGFEGGNSCQNNENLKKNSLKTLQGPLKHQSRIKPKRRVPDFTLCRFKNRFNGQGRKDRSEPSPRFASNSIHTKSRANNL